MVMDADSDEEGAGWHDTPEEYDEPDGLGDVTNPDLDPDLDPDPDSAAYWRRRFIILACGIAAVGLCVWLFPGGRVSAARTSAAGRASMAALAKRGALPSAAYGSAWPGPTATAPPSPAAPSPTALTSPAASPVRSPAAKARKTGTPAAAAGRPRCAPAGIVLSLSASQASYPQRALPTFTVYAVSTSATACTFGYGPGSVRVVVTGHGHVVWDSASCEPPASRPVRFAFGVPQVLTTRWNRRARRPSGCGGSLPAGASGTFDAVATTAGRSSPVRSFRLDR
jgi:hypothetical protein